MIYNNNKCIKITIFPNYELKKRLNFNNIKDKSKRQNNKYNSYNKNILKMSDKKTLFELFEIIIYFVKIKSLISIIY